MRGMVGAEEQRLGDRVHPLGDRPPHSITDPGCTGLTGEDGIQVSQEAAETGKECGLPAAIDPLDGDQQGCPLRIHSSGIVPRWTAVATIAPSNPVSARRWMSSTPETPPP